MNCNEAQDLFGNALDGELAPELAPEFHKHLAACRECGTQYELETITKRAVRWKVKRVPTPPHVFESVNRSLRGKIESSSEKTSWFERLLPIRYSKFALAVGLAAVAMLIFVSLPTRQSAEQLAAHTASNDVINQALNTFSLIRSGELKPSLVSCFAEGVTGYFERNGVKFAVNVKPMESCEWYGALSSEYGDVQLAHVVYKMNNDMMYVYQVSEDAVSAGSSLGLPPAARQALAETGWYTDPLHPNCNVVLWKDRGTLCAAVSTIKKDQLLALLTAK